MLSPAKFFYYRQQLVGDCIDLLPGKVGIGVIIEATSWEAADEKAVSLGIYFDGCRHQLDCGCCGDRWVSAKHSLPSASPHMFEHKMKSSQVSTNSVERIAFPVYVHYMDGTVSTLFWDSGRSPNAAYEEMHD